MPLDHAIFGEGVYTPREAARLIGSSPMDIIRWTRGTAGAQPIWHAHYRELEDSTAISFLDLIEARVVRAFRRAGVSLQSIRYAIGIAETKYGITRPLSSLEFKTEGRDIVFRALEDQENFESLSRRNPGQKIFGKIVDLSLKDLEYQEGRAVRWWPTKDSTIVLDPRRSFGSPILDEFGISTSVLSAEHKAGTGAAQLSQLYEIPLRLVNAAIRYETSLARDDQGSL